MPPQELKRKATELRQSLVAQVLGNPPELPDIPAIREFVAAHSSLQQELESTRQRVSDVSKAKTEYEPLEQKRKLRQQELSKAESALASLYRGFGKVVFEAHLAGHVKDQPAFANRMAIHSRLQQLHKEHESLTPSPQAGLLEKGKVTAKKLMVAGKSKLEELKIGGADTEIGKHLIEARQEESVRCEATSAVLGQIAGSRKALSDRQKEYEDAKAAVEGKGSEICASFCLQRMDGSRTLDAELSRCRHLITQKETELTALKNGLPDKLLAATTLPQDSQLTHLLTELRQAEAELQAAPSSLRERFAKAQPKNRTLVAAGVAVGLVLFIGLVVMVRLGELSNIAKEKAAEEAKELAHQQAVATEIAKAHELWDSGKKTEAVIKYKELMKERQAVEDRSLFSLVYGRVIEREAEEGDSVAARSMIKEALESSISLTLSSAKANSLLTQVHGELEAEDRERERQAEADRRREELAKTQPKKSEAGEGTLTEDYCPDNGKKYTYRDITFSSRTDWLSKEDRKQLEAMGGVPKDEVKEEVKSPQDFLENRRCQGEYVFSHDLPIVKLGALPNDRWQWKTYDVKGDPIINRYTYEKASMFEGHPCAVITCSTLGAGQEVFRETVWYVKGVGIVKKESFLNLGSGRLSPVGTETLVGGL